MDILGHDAPVPMSPAPAASLSFERIAFTNVLKSAFNGPKYPVRAAITDSTQFQALLGKINPFPPVDFASEQLFLVAAGEQTSNRFDVRITSVVSLSDRGGDRPDLCLVSFEEEDTGGRLDVITAPWHLVKTQRLAGETLFVGPQPKSW